MTGMEAVGEAVTGGLLADAAEPQRGRLAPDGHTTEQKCLNCGTALLGDYCHACGQRSHVHRTVGAFFHDLLHGVLHFEGKIWRTLPMLAWHPGALTRRYIAGERARFVSPLALFLFSVFLMFAVLSMLGAPIDVADTGTAEERAQAVAEMESQRSETLRQLHQAERELQTAQARSEPTAPLEARLRELRTESEMRERAYDFATRLADGQEARTAARPGSGEREPEITILSETGWPALDQAIKKAESNPSLLLYKLQSNAYKFSWALIPISLPFVWMLFLHRRRYREAFGAYDHLVFITYSIAFVSLGAIVLSLLRPLGLSDGVIGTVITFVPPVHIYRQLRGAYRLSRWSALWRTAALLVSSFVTLTFFLMLLLLVGVIG